MLTELELSQICGGYPMPREKDALIAYFNDHSKRTIEKALEVQNARTNKRSLPEGFWGHFHRTVEGLHRSRSTLEREHNWRPHITPEFENAVHVYYNTPF